MYFCVLFSQSLWIEYVSFPFGGLSYCWRSCILAHRTDGSFCLWRHAANTTSVTYCQVKAIFTQPPLQRHPCISPSIVFYCRWRVQCTQTGNTVIVALGFSLRIFPLLPIAHELFHFFCLSHCHFPIFFHWLTQNSLNTVFGSTPLMLFFPSKVLIDFVCYETERKRFLPPVVQEWKVAACFSFRHMFRC